MPKRVIGYSPPTETNETWQKPTLSKFVVCSYCVTTDTHDWQRLDDTVFTTVHFVERETTGMVSILRKGRQPSCAP